MEGMYIIESMDELPEVQNVFTYVIVFHEFTIFIYFCYFLPSWKTL